VNVAVPVAGFVLASRRAENRIGWLFLVAGLAIGLSGFASAYALHALIVHHGSLPGGRLSAWLASWIWVISVAMLTLLFLLFPTGRLRSPRWRPAAWFVGGVLTLTAAVGLVIATRLWALVVRFAKSSGEERLQLKWCAAAALVVAVVFVAQNWVNSAAVNVLQSLAFVCLWTAIAMAVLKYRLYDIDRIISRTLAYAIVTGLLVGLYAGLVLLATRVLTFHTPVAVAAATLAAAALFSPLRRRVQQVVDRRFNRARYDADRTVAAFAARLKDEVGLDTIRRDLAGTVHNALEPAHVSVWISQRD
jgi:hypothetical protein